MTIGIKNIGQIAVPVHDLKQAVAFYRDVLELPFLFEFPNLAFFDCGGVRLLISEPENEEVDHPSSIIYFRVEEIQQSYEKLVERNVEMVDEPHIIAEIDGVQTWMVFFKDPDGNMHGLMSETPSE
ncbi:MAG TPA: VOC family protein [Bacillales bacterium]|nr:VOC family protein [Bacillales bacterium]